MGIAGGEVAICFREARIFLDCEEQFRDGFIEAPSDEMRGACYEERREQAGAGTLACPIPISGCPAHVLRTPLTCQPLAKFGLRARARSTNAIIAPISSPKY